MQSESRRWFVAASGAILSSIIVLNACSHSADVSAKAADAPHVSVAVASRSTVSNTFSVAGEFVPYQEVELHAKVAGYIKTISVDIGDRVKTGQVLARLEVPELAAQVQGASASVRHNQEEITRAQSEVTRAEADHAALHAAALRLQQASKARPGLIAEQELDDAMAKDRASEAQVEVAKSALSASRQQLDVSKAEHTRYSALSDYTRITAPFSGVVTWRYSDTGALVQAGTSSSSAQPVVKLAQVDVLRLRVPVPVAIAPYIHIGSSAEIHVQPTGERFTAKVSRLTDNFDRSTRAMQVEIDVPNKNGKLSPGMYADVTLQTQNKPDALTVPVQALLRNGGTTSVMVVGPDHKVQARQIKTGVESADAVEVVAGLNAGEHVIAANPAAYREGDTVVPVPAKILAATAEGGND